MIKNTFEELKVNNSAKEIFKDKSLIFSKRQPPNLKKLLTGAKCKINQKPAVRKCGFPRCILCPIIMTGESYYFKNVDKTFNIKSDFTCDTLNCIYVLKCNSCEKYYIGETNNFRLRTSLHRNHAKNNSGLGVSRHLFACSRGGQEECFSIMPIFKMKEDDAILRRTMEAHFINKYKPDLNVSH